MKIDKQKIYTLYMKEIQNLCDLCEDKSIINPMELVDIVCDIIEKEYFGDELDQE